MLIGVEHVSVLAAVALARAETLVAAEDEVVGAVVAVGAVGNALKNGGDLGGDGAVVVEEVEVVLGGVYGEVGEGGVGGKLCKVGTVEGANCTR